MELKDSLRETVDRYKKAEEIIQEAKLSPLQQQILNLIRQERYRIEEVINELELDDIRLLILYGENAMYIESSYWEEE